MSIVLALSALTLLNFLHFAGCIYIYRITSAWAKEARQITVEARKIANEAAEIEARRREVRDGVRPEKGRFKL